MSLHVPPSSATRKVYHWKSAPWRHLCRHFHRVQWGFLKSKPIPDAIDTFVNILTTAHDRYVSSTLPTIKRPTVWGDCYCQCTYQRKLQAWCRRDWSTYHDSMFVAKRAQAIAFHFHQRSLRTKLQLGPTDRMWWNLTKNISGLSKTHNRSASDVDSLASYFASKLPILIPVCPLFHKNLM